MKNDKNPALLPSGFVDLLPPDAEQEYTAIGKMMAVFASFGYGRVKPPLLEFEESLFAPGPGASMINDTFRVMDPVSHRMMGFRSDITAQIARIASSRLEKEPRPLRVCYANDVLRTKAGQNRIERQFTQVGCEIIGEKNIEADIEACVVAIVGLKEIGVADITIDLAMPHIVGKLLEKLDDEERAVVKSALEHRSLDKLKSNKSIKNILEKLVQASGPAQNALNSLSALSAFREETAKLKTISDGIARALNELGFDDVKITIDPVEMRGFKYYSGMGFTLFAKNIAGALGRGGHYDIHFGGKKQSESANGFTLYMDTVRKAMPKIKPKRAENASYSANWKNIRDRQNKGAIVVRAKGKSK
jgi:ATP phosphoribosyltransferase regulatory subunit